MFVCARRHHQSSKDEDTFTIAPTVAYLMTGAGIFFCIVPFLPGASGNIPKVAFFFYFSPFWLGAFAASAFFLRYQVVVYETTRSPMAPSVAAWFRSQKSSTLMF